MSEDQLSDDLERLICDHFPGHVDQARKLLLRYSGREPDRVRRAIVALSQGRMDRLAHNTEQALGDYRDILYWSEQPNESGGGTPPEDPDLN